ncbi:MAG: hypothetical protein V3U27_18890 [Candidatus Tectomicrobia bacterium]
MKASNKTLEALRRLCIALKDAVCGEQPLRSTDEVLTCYSGRRAPAAVHRAGDLCPNPQCGHGYLEVPHLGFLTCRLCQTVYTEDEEAQIPF